MEDIDSKTRYSLSKVLFPYNVTMEASETWLITGGAGYIGSHIADEFLTNGKDVILFDSLQNGLLSRVEYLRRKHNKEITLIVSDLRDELSLNELFNAHIPTGIVHTAALKSVAQSMQHPEEYLEVNYEATAQLLKIASRYQVKVFIFASTAAIYGNPESSEPIREDDIKKPISPYGVSKLLAEEEIKKYLKNSTFVGTSLRFFNVIGTSSPELMDNSVENLIPIVMNALNSKESPIIYGTDYKTRDGTCIRDYVDVRDIARASLFVADCPNTLPFAMNVGTGKGISVREVIELVAKTAGNSDSLTIEADRRLGDPESLFADVSLITKTLGFTTKFSFVDAVQSLYQENK